MTELLNQDRLKELVVNNVGQAYKVIISEVEKPLLRDLMSITRHNVSKTARILGLSRGTLNTKLREYFGNEFVGTRDEYFTKTGSTSWAGIF